MEHEFDEIVDLPLEYHREGFEVDASLSTVPLGMAICKLSSYLLAIDHHLYHTGQLTTDQARERIREAARKMDAKFDVPYQRLPQ